MGSDIRFVRSQKGMSSLGWPVVLSMVTFFTSATLKIIPHCMDYYSLEKVITSVETDKVVEVRSVSGFCSYVGKGMRINDIRNLDLEKALEVQLEDNQSRARLKHEKREPLINNVNLMVHLDKGFRIRMP